VLVRGVLHAHLLLRAHESLEALLADQVHCRGILGDLTVTLLRELRRTLRVLLALAVRFASVRATHSV